MTKHRSKVPMTDVGTLGNKCMWSCPSMQQNGQTPLVWWNQISTYFLENQEWNNKSINTQDTSHNNWNDWFENQFGLKDSHRCDSDSTLCSSVCSSKIYCDWLITKSYFIFSIFSILNLLTGEDKCACNSNKSEECCLSCFCFLRSNFHNNR